MQINRNNYEAYLLDYWEDTLDQKGRHELSLFFRQNPDLKKNIGEYENFRLQPDETLVFDNKDSLKKIEILQVGEIHQENYEDWIIAAQEQDLSPDEQQKFDEFVTGNPDVKKEISLYRFATLKADESIIYPQKEKLRKSIPFYFHKTVYWPVAVAATLIIAFGIFGLLKNEKQTFINQAPAVTEQINPLVAKPEEFRKDPAVKPDKLPVIENEIPNDAVVANDKKIQKTPKTDGLKLLDTPDTITEPKNDFSTNEHINLTTLAMIPFTDQLSETTSSIIQISERNKMTTAFVRDAIIKEDAGLEKKKSTLGKVFANLGNKIFGGSTSSEPGSVFQDLTNRGKESLNIFADAMPVYRESDNTGRTSTYLALSENLKLKISKNKNRQKPENQKGLD